MIAGRKLGHESSSNQLVGSKSRKKSEECTSNNFGLPDDEFHKICYQVQAYKDMEKKSILMGDQLVSVMGSIQPSKFPTLPSKKIVPKSNDSIYGLHDQDFTPSNDSVMFNHSTAAERSPAQKVYYNSTTN